MVTKMKNSRAQFLMRYKRLRQQRRGGVKTPSMQREKRLAETKMKLNQIISLIITNVLHLEVWVPVNKSRFLGAMYHDLRFLTN